MLGGDRHEGHAHQRVRAGGEHTQRVQCGAIGVAHVELDFQPFRAADPVALHRLDRIRPAVQLVQAVEQFLGIIGDAQEPLRDLALFHHRAGAPAAAVDDLLVGQHGLVDRVPVHHRIAAVRQALAHQPGEHALLVHVIVRRTGGELARPVDGVAQRFQLRAHVLDVGVGPLGRRGLVLDGSVFRRQPERVPAHRLQHVVAGHALVAADHVGDGVVAHMAHVQRTGRVRQHRQAIELGFLRVLVDLEGAGGIPELLGGGFDLLRVVDVRFDGGHWERMLGRCKAVQGTAVQQVDQTVTAAWPASAASSSPPLPASRPRPGTPAVAQWPGASGPAGRMPAPPPTVLPPGSTRPACGSWHR